VSRLEHLREEIAEREASLAALEDAYGHADDTRIDALALAIDHCCDELFQLRAEVEEIEQDIAMREIRRDRAWQYGRVL
jgi:hypothetical protein